MSQKQSLDADLLAAVPDADAVRVLYERHVDAVFRFAVRRCRSPEDVADLVSMVFLELFSAAQSYDRRRSEVRVWLLGIAARCLADQRRSDYRRAELATRLGAAPALHGDEHERVEAMLDAARLAPAAERALADQLTEAEQAIFLLVAHDGLAVAAAARSLGLTPVAGRMRLARARRKLRAAIKADGPVRSLRAGETRRDAVPAEERR
ncbi:MAG TPA: sigma-70 family RNA polymerase sigma factor [Solirubrobacteraceae bacterium]|jgi:RNA polymerase sigma-70 factor (ECF subfamily)